jgi:hypothetical protein
LAKDNEQEEKPFWLDLYENTSVLLTLGIDFHYQKKGLFRMVYKSVSYSNLEAAMNRITTNLTNK